MTLCFWYTLCFYENVGGCLVGSRSTPAENGFIKVFRAVGIKL